jgi:hypothetical protein
MPKGHEAAWRGKRVQGQRGLAACEPRLAGDIAEVRRSSGYGPCRTDHARLSASAYGRRPDVVRWRRHVRL